MPKEIAALPHVESSFNPAAYSKVGAAGLWQFMPSTAKRFMRVDSLVDERLDPYSATEAAANLMLYNYRLLGTWPLAVTAYNHGPGGLRRAQEQLGTSDIAVIVKRYQGATFGFASRNFYVSFLAALEVDRNAEKYFGPITRLPDTAEHSGRIARLHCHRRPGEGVQRRHGSPEGLEPGIAPADLERHAIGAPRLRAAPPRAAPGDRDRRRLGTLAADRALPGPAQRRQPSGPPRRDVGRHRGRKRRRRGAIAGRERLERRACDRARRSGAHPDARVAGRGAARQRLRLCRLPPRRLPRCRPLPRPRAPSRCSPTSSWRRPRSRFRSDKRTARRCCRPERRPATPT